VGEEPVIDLSSIKNCTSETVYIRQNDISREDLNENGRKLIVNVTKMMIGGLIKKSSGLVRML